MLHVSKNNENVISISWSTVTWAYDDLSFSGETSGCKRGGFYNLNIYNYTDTHVKSNIHLYYLVYSLGYTYRLKIISYTFHLINTAFFALSFHETFYSDSYHEYKMYNLRKIAESLQGLGVCSGILLWWRHWIFYENRQLHTYEIKAFFSIYSVIICTT